MIVRLPRGLEVDIDNIPDDFEMQVQKCFSEYTELTNTRIPVSRIEDAPTIIEAEE